MIKKEETLRQKLPLSQFLEGSKSSVETWSKDYENGNRTFYVVKPIELEQWTKGYQWAKTNVTVSKKSLSTLDRYYCPAGEEKTVTDDAIADVSEMRYNTFQQFQKRAFKVWIVDLPKEKENWALGRCTCPAYLKKYLCKHVIGLAIRLKVAEIPPAAKQIPVGQKRRRGRPKKATKALLRE